MEVDDTKQRGGSVGKYLEQIGVNAINKEVIHYGVSRPHQIENFLGELVDLWGEGLLIVNPEASSTELEDITALIEEAGEALALDQDEDGEVE